MFHTHDLNQSLNNSLNDTFHSGILIFHFCLSPFCNGVTVYLESHRMGSTVGLGDSSFFLAGLPFYFSAYHHSNLPLDLLSLCLGLIACRWGIVVPIHMFLLLVCNSRVCLVSWHGDSYLLWWGLFICFLCLGQGGCWDLITLGWIGHDALATNKFVKASIVFGHGVSSLVSGDVDVAVAVALGCCCATGDWCD